MINSFYDLYLKMNTDYSERTALRWTDEDGKTVCSRTFGEFCADIRRFVSYLNAQFGDPAGKHIAFLCTNRYEYVVAIFACLFTECVFVPLNYQKDLYELLDEIERADVSAVVYGPDALEWIPALIEKYDGILSNIFEYLRYPESEIKEIRDPSGLALILYTSGTTGHSKGVMLSRKNLLTSFRQAAYYENKLIFERFPDEDHSFFLVLPLYHVGGLKILGSFLLGYSINICESPRYFYRDIALMPSFLTALVPVIFSSLHKDIKKGHREKLGTLRQIMTVGANADTEAISCLIENGYFVSQGYGLTETTACGTWNTSQDIKHIGSIGTRLEAVQVKLDDGEICLKGDTIFIGYYNDPEETSKVLDSDGWFHTGDLANVDLDGFYYFKGRKKNLIILSGGENVSPEELEEELLGISGIIEAVVKEKNGKICAEIYCDADKRDRIQSAITELNRTLPMYKQMSMTEFRDAPFERTSNGKIKRKGNIG